MQSLYKLVQGRGWNKYDFVASSAQAYKLGTSLSDNLGNELKMTSLISAPPSPKQAWTSLDELKMTSLSSAPPSNKQA